MNYLKIADLNESSIEKWAAELDKQPKRTQLTKDNAELFMKMLLIGESLDVNPKFKAELEKDFMCGMFMKRVAVCHDYEITPSGVLFISMVPGFRPGVSTMMANYLQYLSFTKGIKKFTVDTLAKEVFPFGFFSEATLDEFWDKQKLETDGDHRIDNMLDYWIYGTSINTKNHGK